MEDMTLRLKAGRWLLPKPGIDHAAWACVACDQFTSQPEYWEKARVFVGAQPSTLKMILPECELADAAAKVLEIHSEMQRCLSQGLLAETPAEGFVLTVRTTESGARIGLIALMDLEGYDYSAGSQSLIRPTEGTVVERIPPRLAVRRGAPLEFSHVMMLLDDPLFSVIEPLHQKRDTLPKLYDFTLMLGGGQLTGYAVDDPADIAAVLAALNALKAGRKETPPLLFAVGDGNHSLATAKAYWEEIKQGLTPAEQENHPARFAMAELTNLHGDALLFEPIHRVVFGADGAQLMADFARHAQEQGMTLSGGEQRIVCLHGGTEQVLDIGNAPQTLAVGTLQVFLDAWLAEHPEAHVDYIHGEDAVRDLIRAENTIGFLLPVPKKDSLFPTVIHEGVLPRKTFSMGEAHEKRYYMEARLLG